MNEPELYKQLVELLRMHLEEELEREHVWYEVCRIMHGTPDLRDEFKNFMAPGDGLL